MNIFRSPCFSFCNFCFLVSCFFPTEMNSAQSVSTTEIDVGVVLDIAFQNTSLVCVNMSLLDVYSTHSQFKTRIVLNLRDSMTDVVGAADAGADLIKNKRVKAIIGPGSSMQAKFLIELGKKFQVPIITFSATSPSLASIRSPYFIQATYNDSSQVKAVSAIIKAFSWREVVPIYVNNEFGEGIIPSLVDALQEINARIPSRSAISPNATDNEIIIELLRLMSMPTRVFIVHMLPSLGSRIFSKAKEIGMMEKGYVWILTNGITNLMRVLDESSIESMRGVVAIKTHVPKSKKLQNFEDRWKKRFFTSELNIFDLWAYDATMALAMAVEDVGATTLGFTKTNVSNVGPKLLQALTGTRFEGLAGEFHLINGQLQASAFEIVNFIGKEERVGFWTPRNGLVKRFDKTDTSSYSTRWKDRGLRTIKWPGDTKDVPKGWEIPTKSKKLQIGVPKREGFTEFVKVTVDPDTNAPIITGFCIDVFKEVMQAMQYSVSYELIPFEKPDGKPAGTYNDLVYQVFDGKFDAVVGDTTILSNRSLYVDFTLPYTESGVSMVVSVKKQEKNSNVFFRPFTWQVWSLSFSFAIFVPVVVWFYELKDNNQFGGSFGHQLSTVIWFAASVIVFAQREKVKSFPARVVMITWFFVVLVLIQSYAANLASLLTVNQLTPTVNNADIVLRQNKPVGYQKKSFTFGKLKRYGFLESNLKPFESAEECHALLENGTVSAVFIEVPYQKLFLAQYCSIYMVVEETFKVDGFGFVFPIGSPLVADVSRAILKVQESETMKRMENKWFKTQTRCLDSNSSSVSFQPLNQHNFKILFIIIGCVSSVAFFAFIALFLMQNSDVLVSEKPLWEKLVELWKKFQPKIPERPQSPETPQSPERPQNPNLPGPQRGRLWRNPALIALMALARLKQRRRHREREIEMQPFLHAPLAEN